MKTVKHFISQSLYRLLLIFLLVVVILQNVILDLHRNDGLLHLVVLAHHPHPVRLQLLQLLDVHAGIPGYISIAGINITRDYQVTSIYRYRVDIHTKTLNIGKVIFDTLSLVVTGGYQRQRQKDKKGQGSREKKGRDF